MMPTESPMDLYRRISRRVLDQNGEVYVVSVFADGQLQDPWVFTEFIDASARKAHLEGSAELEGVEDVQVTVHRVRITPAGVHPTIPEDGGRPRHAGSDGR